MNGWLIETTGTDIRTLPAVGVVVETSCRYLSELRFPSQIIAGLAVDRLGRTSVTYRLALFAAEPEPAAIGRFVHVYVDRDARRPVPIPAPIRQALAGLVAVRRPSSG